MQPILFPIINSNSFRATPAPFTPVLRTSFTDAVVVTPSPFPGGQQPLNFKLWARHGPYLPGGAVHNLVDPIPVLPALPQPLLFKLKGKNRISYPKVQPLPMTFFSITGTTRDSAGSALADCVVQLFRTSNDTLIGETVSDGKGYYEFRIVGPPPNAYYIVAYKTGAPDVAGTSVNTLTGQ